MGIVYVETQIQWDEINSKGSTTDKMMNAMKNYEEFLRFSAKKYKDAQVDAVNRADRLPRW